MMVRTILFPSGCFSFRDKIVCLEVDAEEIGITESRLDFDEDVADQSGAVYEFTNRIMMVDAPKSDMGFMIFPSRRWRSHREGADMRWPKEDEKLLYIGNPMIVWHKTDGSIVVERQPEFLIRSGVELEAMHP